ncbi:MAG TPA: hypothetical protein VIY48_17620 [Candidatus Paceibacterota bacterium]
MDKPVLATIDGTMLVPGVSRNNRQYTESAIGRAVKRMKERLTDPDGLPIYMRTHHGAGDNSREIVGQIVNVAQERDGSATYKARLFNTEAGRDIATILTPQPGGKPTLPTSIYGYWVGPVENVSSADGTRVEVGEDLEVESIDFTGSPGVVKSRVHSIAFESTNHVDYSDKKKFVEPSDAFITMADPVVEVADDDEEKLEIYERKFSAKQRKSMAAAGQAMPGGRYPIANKSDLRNAIRAVGRGKGSHDEIRRHVIQRAKALGLSNLIPPNWTRSGGKKESTVPVGEHYVKVCIGDIDGDMIKLCAYNLNPDIIKDAIKKAGKLADQMIGEDGTDLGMQDEDDLVDDVDNIDWKIITCSPDGDDYDTIDYDGDGDADDGMTGMPKETVQRIRKSITAARESKTKGESAMAETQAATAALPESYFEKLAETIAKSVAEAMAQQGAAAAAVNAAADGKAKNKKKKKADINDNEQANETVAPAGAITEAVLTERLEAERKRVTDELRETFLKENGTPDRKGFRHLSENDKDDPSKLSGDELWNKRGEVWSQFLPQQFGQPVA